MDWIKSGWGDNFSQIFNSNKKYHLDFSNAHHSSRPVNEICIDAIKKICEIYPPPYTLMLSGGIDSQAMLWCWKNTNIDFDTVTIRYVDNDGNILNNHDISNVENYASLYNIHPTYIDFNIIHFLENYLHDYAIKYQCTSPQITTYMCMSEMIHEGTILFSGDFLATAIYSYTIYGLKRYTDITKRNIIPFFLLHDSELATVLTREIKHLTTQFNPVINNHYVSEQTYLKKVTAMKKLGIPLLEQKTKLSGFEGVKDYYDTQPTIISAKDRLKYSNMPSKRVFDIAFRYKLGEIIKYEDTIICH